MSRNHLPKEEQRIREHLEKSAWGRVARPGQINAGVKQIMIRIESMARKAKMAAKG